MARRFFSGDRDKNEREKDRERRLGSFAHHFFSTLSTWACRLSGQTSRRVETRKEASGLISFLLSCVLVAHAPLRFPILIPRLAWIVHASQAVK